GGIRDRTVTGVQTCALPICDVGAALARSIVSAALLVLTLVIVGLTRRHAERGSRRGRRRSEYRRRLERFGYVLGRVMAWFAFGEIGRASCRERRDVEWGVVQ